MFTSFIFKVIVILILLDEGLLREKEPISLGLIALFSLIEHGVGMKEKVDKND